MSVAIATTDTETAPRDAWLLVAVLTAAAVLSYTDRQILSLIVDPVRASLHISETQIGLIQGAAFAVLYACVGLPLGRAADILPRKRVILTGILVWSCATVASGFAASFWTLFAARLCVGFGEAALAPAALSLIASAFPAERRGLAIGVFLTGIVIGTGASFGGGGALLAFAESSHVHALPILGAMEPWRVVMILAGLPGFPIALALLLLRDIPHRERGGFARALSLAPLFRAFAARKDVLLPLYGALALSTIGDYAFFSWVPTFMSRVYHASSGTIAFDLAVTAIGAGLVGTLGGSVLSDMVERRGGARLMFAALFFVLALPATLIGFMPNFVLVLDAFTLWLLVSSVTGTVAITALQELLPDDARGVATATISFCNTLVGLGLGPVLVAIATQYFFGTPLAVGKAITLVVFPAAALGAVLFLVAGRRAQNTRSSVSVSVPA
jgi:predicted MFS family arabinose efflux permease